ncbi:hypothetical protein AUC69_10925 [Methyloceanibacter superfactus]|uniref:Uncharacterized protein n=1 Tax=Methyloceanibacter superfactus TaxID=1774969 RepID=A0A1E3VVN7_9HYPH|nr:hypothetical protein AUC69_10925 [Methyloceanibacter superfactus]
MLLAASYQQFGSDTHMAESRIAWQRTSSASAGVPPNVMARKASKNANIVDRMRIPLGFNNLVPF